MAIIEKEVLLKAIYDPGFAKGAFAKLPTSAFSEHEEYKEIYQSIRDHYRLQGEPLTERVLLNLVEDRLLRRKANDDKVDKHIDLVHDLYTIKREQSDESFVDSRVNEFVRGKLVYKIISEFVSSGNDFGDDKALSKLVPELQEVSTMNISGGAGQLIDFFEDTSRKKELYRQLESAKFLTGFNSIDVASGGGLARGEVGMIIGSTGSGKCVTGDTLVQTEKGLLKIQEIPYHFSVDPVTGESKAKVASYTTEGEYIPRETSHWFNMGYSKTIKIRTARGFEIEGTPEHPLLVINQEGNLEFVELRNMKYGDFITLATPDMWAKQDKVDPETAYMMGLTDGIQTDDTEKEVFNLILQSTRKTVKRYLNGIMDTRGVIDQGVMTIELASPKMVKQIQTLLLNLDILAMRRRNRYTGLFSSLEIEGTELLNLMHDFDFNETDIQLMLPVGTKKTLKDVEKDATHIEDTTPTIKAYDYLVNTEKSDTYITSVLNSLAFDEIVSFEDSEAEVYDFTVPVTHSFVANGIVSHNTTWAVQQLNNYTKRGMNTLYIALEENLGRMLFKIEQNLLGVSKSELIDSEGKLKEDVFEVAQAMYAKQLNIGKMFISKHRPQEVTISDIEQVILDVKFRKGVQVDAVIIDYPDLMKNTHSANGASESDAGGKLLEDIRALADKHQYVCWVLSQLNRSGWGQDVKTAESIEGSKRKLNAVEMAFTLNQNSDEFERGLLRVHIDKMRYGGEGGFSKIQYFKMDRDGLRIRDESQEEIEEHKALIGDPSGEPRKKEVNNNKQVLSRIESINNAVGGS